jgi:hypothetical protein
MGAKKKAKPGKSELQVNQRALVPKASTAHTKDPDTGLTSLQEAFARCYARSCNVPKAYKEAGYADQGSLERNAQASYRIMTNPLVMNRIEYWRKRFDQLLDIEDRRVIVEVAAIALSDPGQLFNDVTNEPIPITQLPERIRRCISSVKRTTNADGDVVWEYKLWDKIKALELLGQIKGMTRAKAGAKALVRIKMQDGEMEVATTVRSES